MSETDKPPVGSARRPDEGRTCNRYDWSETAPSTAVIETIAVATNTVPTEADPLYDVIEPDALDDLFDPAWGPTTPELDVSFHYQDLEVSVSATGTVTVQPAGDVPPYRD